MKKSVILCMAAVVLISSFVGCSVKNSEVIKMQKQVLFLQVKKQHFLFQLLKMIQKPIQQLLPQLQMQKQQILLQIKLS